MDEAAAAGEPSESQKRTFQFCRDLDGVYCLGPREAVHEVLNVQKYMEAFPAIPKEELLASSVRHPDDKSYLWLLHVRRVPLGPDTPGAETPPHQCAGVGLRDATTYICYECRNCLCVKSGISMPPFALANKMWLGREHPAFQNLTLASRMLLGLGRCWRKVHRTRGDNARMTESRELAPTSLSPPSPPLPPPPLSLLS